MSSICACTAASTRPRKVVTSRLAFCTAELLPSMVCTRASNLRAEAREDIAGFSPILWLEPRRSLPRKTSSMTSVSEQQSRQTQRA